MENNKDDIDLIFLDLEELLDNTLSALRQDLSKINIGRAQSDIFDLFKVEYHGAMVPLPHMAVISVLGQNKVVIEPYEKAYVKNVEKVIRNSELDLNPQVQGNVINVFFPQMTLEKRDKLIKLSKQYGEKSKVAIRNHRRTALDMLAHLALGRDVANLNIKEIERQIKKAVELTEELVALKNKNLQELK